MAKKINPSNPIFFRINDDAMKELEKQVKREREEHPGRRVTASGLAKEIFIAALQWKR